MSSQQAPEIPAERAFSRGAQSRRSMLRSARRSARSAALRGYGITRLLPGRAQRCHRWAPGPRSQTRSRAAAHVPAANRKERWGANTRSGRRMSARPAAPCAGRDLLASGPGASRSFAPPRRRGGILLRPTAPADGAGVALAADVVLPPMAATFLAAPPAGPLALGQRAGAALARAAVVGDELQGPGQVEGGAGGGHRKSIPGHITPGVR